MDIIKQAKEKYPVSIHYKGRLTKEEISEIEKFCTINTPSVYMDGSCYYVITYRP